MVKLGYDTPLKRVRQTVKTYEAILLIYIIKKHFFYIITVMEGMVCVSLFFLSFLLTYL